MKKSKIERKIFERFSKIKKKIEDKKNAEEVFTRHLLDTN